MVFYKFSLKGIFERREELKQDESHAISINSNDKDYILDLNNLAEDYFGPGRKERIIFTRHHMDRLSAIYAGDIDVIETNDYIKRIKKLLSDEAMGEVHSVDSIEEISAIAYKDIVEGINPRFTPFSTRSIFSELKIDYDDNSTFKINEFTLNGEKFPSDMAIKKAKELLGDQSLHDELDRIYDSKNFKGFYGHPVHYLIKTSSDESSKEISKLLIKSLLYNKRLLSGRAEEIYEITSQAYAESDLQNVIRGAAGGTVIIDMSGINDEDSNYASAYEEVTEFLNFEIKNTCGDTLFIFIQKDNSRLSKELLGTVGEYLDLVEIKEGFGDEKKANEFLMKLIENSKVSAIKDNIMLPGLKKNKLYSLSDIYGIFNKWNDKSLKQYIYTSYDDRRITVKKTKKKKESAISKLDRLIGLKEAKEVAHQIIATGKINDIRQKQGFTSARQSMHMIFTGNPGSAKTTVARLLADALSEEGIISSGCFVECGRSDLVGKYVGWTAPTVRKKFRQAMGGVLFIDEAYSLVDDTNGSFGDEAITTIVQEMENHRDDVIVIFAGYPDKMERFLEKNEGLRSRIAFHMNFPDYQEEELTEIFKLMIKERGYFVSEDCVKEATKVFGKACKEKDYGNGRFVRNYIEQATMKQSLRLYDKYQGKKIPKKRAMELLLEDFDVVINRNQAKAINPIGFVA